MMIRMLDLTLILLLAFLTRAELSVEQEVPLPDAAQSAGAGTTVYLEVAQAYASVRASAANCRNVTNTRLETCLGAYIDGPSVVVTPEPGVTVQRLVDVLDVCARAGVTCGVAAQENR